jgi:hypothetical protein
MNKRQVLQIIQIKTTEKNHGDKKKYSRKNKKWKDEVSKTIGWKD